MSSNIGDSDSEDSFACVIWYDMGLIHVDVDTPISVNSDP